MKIEDETASLTDDKYLRDDFVLCSYKISCSIEKSKAKEMKKKLMKWRQRKRTHQALIRFGGDGERVKGEG